MPLVGVIGLFFVHTANVYAQKEVVFSIGDKMLIDRTEFNYQLSKSGKQEKDFKNIYIDYKLKVCEAEAQGLDTTEEFKSQYSYYTSQILKPYFQDQQRLIFEEQRISSREQNRLNLSEWVKIAHISVDIPQFADAKLEYRARTWMDSIYSAVKSGSDFISFIKKFGPVYTLMPEKLHVTLSELQWMPANRNLKEWMENLVTLEKGKVSVPFASPKGMHLIKLIDRRSDIPLSMIKPLVDQYLESLGSNNPTINKDNMLIWNKGGLVLLEQKYPELKLQLQDVHDGLLVMAFDKQYVDKTLPDDAILERYYAQHKNNWKVPCFKGAVIHAKNKKIAKTIKKYLKSQPIDEWKTAYERLVSNGEEKDMLAQVEIGIFQIGKNAAIDKKVFKQGTYQPDVDYPITLVIGKKMKNGPEDFKDVKEQVTHNFLSEYEEQLLKHLREKYHVERN